MLSCSCLMTRSLRCSSPSDTSPFFLSSWALLGAAPTPSKLCSGIAPLCIDLLWHCGVLRGNVLRWLCFAQFCIGAALFRIALALNSYVVICVVQLCAGKVESRDAGHRYRRALCCVGMARESVVSCSTASEMRCVIKCWQSQAKPGMGIVARRYAG